MEIQPPRFDFWIEAEEGERIREALQRTGVALDRATAFSGATIHKLLEEWEQFVTTDWTRWDVAEYSNDIHVRHTLEVVRTSLGDASRQRLDAVLAPLDQIFKRRMYPVESRGSARSRFWVANTIWDTPEADSFWAER